MARCTAPVNGHRTASGRANCPACRNGSGYYSGYSGYSGYSSYGSGATHYSSSGFGSSSRSGGSGGSRRGGTRPRWSPSSSTVVYTPAEVRSLTPVRETAERLASREDLRDVFPCHAWDDRTGAAKELHDLLEGKGVTVWFSEKDVPLGTSLLREIDRGLARSRVGIVLVTPAFLKRVAAAGIADKELSALLHRDQLVPIVHQTTYEKLRDVSPLLGSRSGLSTTEDSMDEIATKLSELVSVEPATA